MEAHFQAQTKEIARVSSLTFTDQRLTPSIDINKSILELVKDKNKFDSSFETSMKKKTIVSRKHAFDSKNSVIIVGDNNTKYPFDTEEPIYALSDINKKCLKAKGVQLNPTLIIKDDCYVCKKPKSDWKSKKVVQCDFCAKFGCQECIQKQFPFPQLYAIG